MKNLLKTTVTLTAAVLLAVTPVSAKTSEHILPTASNSLTKVLNIGHTSDGSMGTLSIGSYSAKLYASSSQSVVDAENSAAYIQWGQKVLIADHASQGFRIIRTLGAGATGTITDDAGTTVLTMASSYQGTNTGNGINLSDGSPAENKADGTYILYTCNDSEGVSVTVTYWNGSEAAQTVQAAQPAAASAAGVAMYRLYNPNSGEHFYTGSVSERDYLSSLGWRYEGVGWTAPASSNSPVYRLYNRSSGDHHYTTSVSERDWLVTLGWKYEGIGWYSDDNKTVPLYREFNPNVSIGTHNYTTSQYENDWLVSLGWHGEGIGWYGIN